MFVFDSKNSLSLPGKYSNLGSIHSIYTEKEKKKKKNIQQKQSVAWQGVIQHLKHVLERKEVVIANGQQVDHWLPGPILENSHDYFFSANTAAVWFSDPLGWNYLPRRLSHRPSSVSCDLAKSRILLESRLFKAAVVDCTGVWDGAEINLQDKMRTPMARLKQN